MNKVQKMVTAGVLVALGVALSTFSIPVGASRCFPVQHMVNILAGVLLGPGWAVGMAFATSLLRVLMGTGTLLAFPGSMVGALCCGLLYKYGGRIWMACVGELVGTGILGGLLGYPVAAYLMGREAALLGYVVPFLLSSFSGVVIALVLLTALGRTSVFRGVLNKAGTGKGETL